MKTKQAILVGMGLLIGVAGCGQSKTTKQQSAGDAQPSAGAPKTPVAAKPVTPLATTEVQEANQWMLRIAALPFPPTVHLSSNLVQRGASIAWRGQGIKELIDAFTKKDWKSVVTQMNGGADDWLSPDQPSATAAKSAYERLLKKELDLLVNAQTPMAAELKNGTLFAFMLPPEVNQPVTKDWEPMANGVLADRAASVHPDGKGVLLEGNGLSGDCIPIGAPEVFLYLQPKNPEGDVEIRTDSWDLDKPFKAFLKRNEKAAERKNLGEITDGDVVKEVAAGRDEYRTQTVKILTDLLGKM